MATSKKKLIAGVSVKELLTPKIGQEIVLKGVIDSIDTESMYGYVRVSVLNSYSLTEADIACVVDSCGVCNVGDFVEDSFWISFPTFRNAIEDSNPELRKLKLQEKIKQMTEDLAAVKKEWASI